MKSRLHAFIDGQVRDLNCLVRDKNLNATKVRFMTTTQERIQFVRTYYEAVSKVYALRFGQDAVDHAFEAFILGFIDKLDLVPLMREYSRILREDIERLPF